MFFENRRVSLVSFFFRSKWLKKKQSPIGISVKKGVLRILQNSHGNISAGVSFLIKLQAKYYNFFKRENLTQLFSCEFCEVFKSTFFTGHLWATASVVNLCGNRLISQILHLWWNFLWIQLTAKNYIFYTMMQTLTCTYLDAKMLIEAVNHFWKKFYHRQKQPLDVFCLKRCY